MDGPTGKPKASWLELLRSGDDADLGAGMVRLAKLAAALHQVEAELGADVEAAPHAAGVNRLDDARELQGRSSGRVARAGFAGPFRKEVER